MLIIEHLTKQYKGSNKGVTDLSLHVEPGDIYAFIGHNGAGSAKTAPPKQRIGHFSRRFSLPQTMNFLITPR